MSNYLKELEAIQTWIKATAGLNSVRLKEASPKVARPVILWETPSRGKARNLSQYVYVQKVRQFGRLFVSSLEELLKVQEQLSGDLEEKNNVIPVKSGVDIIGYLKAVAIEFNDSERLDVPFNISYEVTYGKAKPAEAPPATKVGIKMKYGGV